LKELFLLIFTCRIITEVGGWTDIPASNAEISTGGGSGSSGSSTNNSSSIVDFRGTTNKQRIETFLHALQNGRCIISEMFSYFPSVSYTSPPEGTNVTICGENYKVVIIVSNFSDDLWITEALQQIVLKTYIDAGNQ
jgi:hypothetical protein